MGDEQLRLTIEETEKTLFKLRMQASTERLDVPSELRRQRRLIARVKTVQTQRQLAKAGK
jgi:large subunit ribosomal protein L29